MRKVESKKHAATAVLDRPEPVVEKKLEPIIFGKPDIGDSEINAVTDVLRSGWLSTGEIVNRFEREFEEFIGSGHAVAVNSGTTGLMLSMAVACIGGGCEVITTPLTFAATINAILALGAKPIFVDVDEHGNLDAYKIKPYLLREGHRIRAILPVHYCGAAADMREILHLADFYGVKVIEDAAHAFGGEFVGPPEGNLPGKRQKIGTVSNFTVFSLYATKNITAGEGGMVVTKQAEFAERIRALSNQGLSADAWGRYGSGPIRSYEVMHPGYKGNMSDIHAAIGLAQLRRWPELKVKREKVWNIYEDAFGWKEPGHSKHLFTIQVKNRDQFRLRMKSVGIGTGLHYRPLHLEPGYHMLGYKRGDFPNAEKIGDNTVSLPVTSTMTEDDAHRVVTAAKKFREEVERGV